MHADIYMEWNTMQGLKICLESMQVTKQCIQQESYFVGEKNICTYSEMLK